MQVETTPLSLNASNWFGASIIDLAIAIGAVAIAIALLLALRAAIKRWLGDTPDETAFFRRPLRRLLERTGYRDVRVEPFDFLHPKTPAPLINGVDMLGGFLENVPVVSEFAGSLYIRAVK